jgi:arginine decarboxylase
MSNLYEKLVDYSRSRYYPFHMPGHKRNMGEFVNPYEIDITEIDGFDNLHHAQDILKEGQQAAARLYGADESFYLINGSTGGILSAISGCTSTGGTILMGRNCHKSAYHAVFLKELDCIYSYPQINREVNINCGLNPLEIEELLIKNTDIEAVFITSPTYEGVVSDIKQIAKVVHNHGIPLIVDEAHGAHFGFHEYFPKSAVTLGADIVIQSLHKTLPAFTQTGLLHMCGNLVNRDRIRKYLGIYQTSSPSYVLMAGIARCISLLENQSEKLFNDYARKLSEFREYMQELHYIKLISPDIVGESSVYDLDCSKLVFTTGGYGLSGKELYDKLRDDYYLQMEMVNGDEVLAMTSPLDGEDGYNRLRKAILEIDESIGRRLGKKISNEKILNEKGLDEKGLKEKELNGKELSKKKLNKKEINEKKVNEKEIIEKELNQERLKKKELEEIGIIWPQEKNKTAMSISSADHKKKRLVKILESEGCVSGEFIYLYPPGIPLITPGEIINSDMIRFFKACKRRGIVLQGLTDFKGEILQVIDEQVS